MTYLDSIVLGFVEGITEFLPISSTGHLILTSQLLNIESSTFLTSFTIAIQLGAIFAVIALYYKQLLDPNILKKLIVGFIPTGIIGLTLYRVIKTYLLGNELVVLAALAIGGAALIVFEYLYTEPEQKEEKLTDITYTQAALVGVFQTFAMIPGVSRSAATIVGGLLLGIRRTAIVEFSFLLAVPTMLAATGLDLVKNAAFFSSDEFGLLATGFATSCIVALFSIRFLLSYVRKHSFVPFGIYRILLALLFFFIIL